MPNLVVVGSGIKSIAHLTEETKRVIQNADKVLYLVNEDNLKTWINRESKEAESLEPIYFNYPKRIYPSPLKVLENLFEIDYKDRHEISST